MTKKTKSGLQFEYCECGCKGHAASPTEGLHFWIFNDLTGAYYLHKGHGFYAPLLGTYETFGDAVEHATKVTKKVLKDLQAYLGE